MASDDGAAARRRMLASYGAADDVLDALVAYTVNPFDLSRLDASGLPLADGPQMDAWEEYARDAHDAGVAPALARRLVQWRFPIEAGISRTEAYRAATRRGDAPEGDACGLALEDPDGLTLELWTTLAGRVPVITCATRADFVTLVRACSCRNEPEPVPQSMGACIVNGLNNWDRVARVRRRMEAERGAPFDEDGWNEAFRQIVPQKAQYQDRLIVLSREPYSAVPSMSLGIGEAEWRERSIVIRREHECTHYFTLVAFGLMRNNLFDELIADFAGLARAYGRYDADLALRFLGLESYPAYRAGGRFENYLADPPVGPAAAAVLRDVVVRAARGVAAFTAGMELGASSVRGRMVVALAGSTLVELASGAVSARLRERLASVPAIP